MACHIYWVSETAIFEGSFPIFNLTRKKKTAFSVHYSLICLAMQKCGWKGNSFNRRVKALRLMRESWHYYIICSKSVEEHSFQGVISIQMHSNSFVGIRLLCEVFLCQFAPCFCSTLSWDVSKGLFSNDHSL